MDNLPIPQSRIEELMNAFISRDSSQISTPQSRIEEFWYHLIEGTNALPIPQSRIELLLKKIIENDTKQIPLAKSRAEEFLVSILTGDINKLPIPQSRSEYYLDYIARNNLVLDDIEYVKYSGTNITASNTVQKPFRSAILKGQTLVNISKFESNIERTSTGTSQTIYSSDVTMLKTSATYTFIYWIESTSGTSVSNITTLDGSDTQMFDRKVLQSSGNLESNFILKFSQTSRDFTGHYGLKFSALNGSVKLVKSVILEGDYTNVDIPYFDGMQSVKMPVLTTTNLGNLISINDLEQGGLFNTNGVPTNFDFIRSDFIEVTHDEYTLSHNSFAWTKIFEYDENKEFIRLTNIRGDRHTTEVTENTKYIRISIELSFSQVNSLNISLCPNESTNKLPYKSNILTVNEEVTLRGIDDVKDTLDSTGTLTQRIGEIMLDGSEHWLIYNGHFYTTNSIANHSPKCMGSWLNGVSNMTQIGVMCDKGVIRINLNNINDDIQVLKNTLSQNPLILHYELKTPIIKTVDLKVVDQDGNPVKQLSAFDETTHIVSSSASDNSLIAIAEVEVPTKLIEALNAVKSLSSDVEMLINEVDNAQKLQDENSTMVMSAMTELYEMVLVMGGGS